MSVYRPRNKAGEFTSPYYHYDFQCGGARFHGSTAETERREAERVERAKRAEAKALRSTHVAAANRPLTVQLACTRYWEQQGKHLASADDTWRYLGLIQSAFGANTLLRDITSAKVADAVARRRMDQVAPATVNRTLTEPLRRIMRMAVDVWEEPVRAIAWKKILLPEPIERVREASHEEEAKLLSAIRDDHRPALEFMMLTGCRLAEVVGLSWDRVYWTARSIEIRGKGSRGRPDKIRFIPITNDLWQLLWRLRGDHPSAVFTYVATRPDRQRAISRGDRVPITYQGLKTRWRRDRAGSGVENFRLHDTRHTALTRLVRETGNLKIAQKLAGHTEISTTAKYAHANLDDIRSAMERTAKADKAQNRRTNSRKKSRNETAGSI